MHEPDQPPPVTSSAATGPSDSAAFVPEPVPVSVAVAPPLPARRRRTGLVVGLVVVVLVLVAGSVVAAAVLKSDKAATAPSATAAASASTSASPAPVAATTAAKYVGTLAALAVPMPAGANRENLRMGARDGTLDLEAVVTEYDAADQASMRNRLTGLDFERGLFLAWTDATGVLIYVQIYQFRYERQAAEWSVAQARLLDGVAESTAAFDEILGGRWATTSTPNGRHAVHANYCKNDLAVMIDTFTTGTADTEYLKRLAVDQYRRLP